MRFGLEGVRPSGSTHAGLWLERFIPDDKKDGGKQEHIAATLATVRVPEGYTRFFEGWKKSLGAMTPKTVLSEVEASGRLVVGLGAESVLETSVTLHRTWGVPFLPGSALKGLASSYAARRLEDERWRRSIGESHRVLFGVQENAGHVQFHDALWIPSGNSLPLDLDVMTVHHPNYYQGKDVPPADWDSPIPVPFVSARGKYLLALTGPQAWVEAAVEILVDALRGDGIGAKTAAGYGRMIASDFGSSHSSAGSPDGPGWAREVAALEAGSAAQRVPSILGRLQANDRREAANAIVVQLKRKWLSDPKRASAEWVRALLDAAGD